MKNNEKHALSVAALLLQKAGLILGAAGYDSMAEHAFFCSLDADNEAQLLPDNPAGYMPPAAPCVQFKARVGVWKGGCQ